MGPSGSGKTTLLDLLAGRKTVGKTEGSILFAGNKPTRQFLRRYTGYVEQFDTLLPILTVEEMLRYTAELKQPRHIPLNRKQAAVEELLDKLALQACRCGDRAAVQEWTPPSHQPGRFDTACIDHCCESSQAFCVM